MGRKTSLDLIKEEWERVKSRVDNMNKDRVKSKQGAGNTDNKQGGEEESDDEMKSLMKDVRQMEEEVKDISQDVENEDSSRAKEKPKKKKKRSIQLAKKRRNSSKKRKQANKIRN